MNVLFIYLIINNNNNNYKITATIHTFLSYHNVVISETATVTDYRGRHRTSSLLEKLTSKHMHS